MTKYNLYNNGKPIGKGNFNKKNIKLLKESLYITALSFAAALAICSCTPKPTPVKEETSIVQEDKKDDLRLNIEDGVIKPHDMVAPAYYMFDENNNLLTNDDLQNTDSKTITFVPSQEVTDVGYVLDDNLDVSMNDLDAKYEWCDYYYHQLLSKVQANDNRVDPSFDALKSEYDLLNLNHDELADFKTYKEYINTKPSIQNGERFDQLLDKFADDLALWVGFSYKAKAISQAEVERVKDIEEMDNIGGPYYKITDYRVPANTTLSELVGGYANNSKQYEDLLEQVIKDNNIENPDLIYEGQILTLSGLDEQDLYNLGYRLPNEAELVDQYLKCFAEVENSGLPTLTGDAQADQIKGEILVGMNEFRQLVNEPGEKDELALAKSIVEKINTLTGYQMDIVAHKR